MLDEQTKPSLASHEQFFVSLFQLPNEYEQASEAKKTQLINQWLEELQDNNYEKITEAAAYLGIVKAKEAGVFLEKLLTTGKGGVFLKKTNLLILKDLCKIAFLFIIAILL